MALLVCDTNILLDWFHGGRIDVLFRLEATLALPDVLFEELGDKGQALEPMGLVVCSLEGFTVQRVLALSRTHRRPSRSDLMALALAEQERAVLLTGDGYLRAAAQAEGIEVHGTLWVAIQAIELGVLSPAETRRIFLRMRDSSRRLPWSQVDAQLLHWGVPGLPDRRA